MSWCMYPFACYTKFAQSTGGHRPKSYDSNKATSSHSHATQTHVREFLHHCIVWERLHKVSLFSNLWQQYLKWPLFSENVSSSDIPTGHTANDVSMQGTEGSATQQGYNITKARVELTNNSSPMNRYSTFLWICYRFSFLSSNCSMQATRVHNLPASKTSVENVTVFLKKRKLSGYALGHTCLSS